MKYIVCTRIVATQSRFQEIKQKSKTQQNLKLAKDSRMPKVQLHRSRIIFSS